MTRKKEARWEEITGLEEGIDLEAKAAQGKDGQGEVPREMWKSYSAFANTDGGQILLGVQEEEDGHFEIVGLGDPKKVQRDVIAQLRDRHVISADVTTERGVYLAREEQKDVIVIEVPKAPRQTRPVYVGRDLWKGTYKRKYEGDYLCEAEEIRQMLRDSTEAGDREIAEAAVWEDIDLDTLRSYRERLKFEKPDFVGLSKDIDGFLISIGGARREKGLIKPTRAGLLMFGEYQGICNEFPNYFVDYQERGDGERYRDRIAWDGTWAGNLYQFFFKAYSKLKEPLPIPFRLDGEGARKDETALHVAVREALVNTLVHADYQSPTSVVVRRERGRMVFENPGGLRVSLEELMEGGSPSPRNPTLQTMFRLIGFGERAGTGGPKIIEAWKGKMWKPPIWERLENPERTRLTLPLESLLPEEASVRFEKEHAGTLADLSPQGRSILFALFGGGEASHERLLQWVGGSGRDLSLLLQTMVDDGSEEERSKEKADTEEQRIQRAVTLFQEKKRVRQKGQGVAQLLLLCEVRSFSLRELSEICQRKPGAFKAGYLRDLVRRGQLEEIQEGESYLDWRYKTKAVTDSGEGKPPNA